MRILVFQHSCWDHPATFGELWAENGIEWVGVDLPGGQSIPDCNGFDLLFVTGGPMMVWDEEEHPWLIPEKSFIRRWVKDLGRPYFGICLGHQLLATALGGEVTPMNAIEFGIGTVKLSDAGRRDPLFLGCADSIETFHWHSAQVSVLPTGSTVLAGNAACSVQAMRWGEHAYAVQYHCELNAEMLRGWQQLSAFENSIKEAKIRDAKRFSDEIHSRLPQFRTTARQINDAMLLAAGGR
jgi:GMP synthase-like glutamine amidotransferase